MEIEEIVEYIDRQKILCAIVMEIKGNRLRLLTESNREVNLSTNRLLHKSKKGLHLSLGRDNLINSLREISAYRKKLAQSIDIKGLWEILNTEQEWIDIKTMTAFCFSESHDGDHESAVVRAFFHNRLYFKFDQARFFPHSEEQVERNIAHLKEKGRKKDIIEKGSEWVKRLSGSEKNNYQPEELNDSVLEIIDILKSVAIFEKESKHYSVFKDIFKKANINSTENFRLLVKAGVFADNENIDLYKSGVSLTCSNKTEKHASDLSLSLSNKNGRRDLTDLSVMTIDGRSTLDFDDALSIEKIDDHYRLGIHIVDVGHFVKKDDVIDREALERGSSIYMPDQIIPMLPSCLAEDLCSLKAGKIRPAISVMINLSRFYEIIDYEIVHTIIKVKHQLTYYETNLMLKENKDITILHEIAKTFQQFRIKNEAVQISLPNINVWVEEDGKINVCQIKRESPSRMLVAEIMIMANWIMSKFLSENSMPAIFRSQSGPKERLYHWDDGTLFQNCMQRRLMNRFVLNSKPGHHSGLGLTSYVTATSPIRKYFDLSTQRQIRAVLGLEEPYSKEEIDTTINMLAAPMHSVLTLQRNRVRYWLLKYLESKIGQKEDAIILYKRRDYYQILIPEYMLECNLSQSGMKNLKPESLVSVTIQNVNARKDILTVFLG
ncbi:MAG: RNB domain-containing ribonuclease [Deltaproteobacteria bacterium]|nr:RNB domain-containing ribonuclease [Deltaproteobacteria bacterium]